MATVTTLSGAQFDALPYEEGLRWELVSGELIPVSGPSWDHNEYGLRLVLAIREYLATGAMKGRANHEVEFALSENDRLKPDVCVLLGDTVTCLDRTKNPIPGAPDIAIEIISPSERTSESNAKVVAYLKGGVTEVWQIDPETQLTQIHRGDNSRRISWQDPLESRLLPGLTLRLDRLFKETQD